MRDTARQLQRIVAVRDIKRTVARHQLAMLVGRVADALAHAAAAREEAIQIRLAAGRLIGEQRANILTRAFQVDQITELRKTIEHENVRCANADKSAAFAVEAASRIELERAAAARKLVALDARSNRLEERLKELRSAEQNVRDRLATEDFTNDPSRELS